MVQNSAIRFPVSWQSSHLEPGEYTVFPTADLLGEELSDVKTLIIERKDARDHEELVNEFHPEEATPSIPAEFG